MRLTALVILWHQATPPSFAVWELVLNFRNRRYKWGAICLHAGSGVNISRTFFVSNGRSPGHP
jgi:hypothetical protein